MLRPRHKGTTGPHRTPSLTGPRVRSTRCESQEDVQALVEWFSSVHNDGAQRSWSSYTIFRNDRSFQSWPFDNETPVLSRVAKQVALVHDIPADLAVVWTHRCVLALGYKHNSFLISGLFEYGILEFERAA